MGNVCAGSCSCRCKGCPGFRKCNFCSGFRKCNCCSGFKKCNWCSGFRKCNCCSGIRKCNCCSGFGKCNCCSGFGKCNFCAGKSFGSICTWCCRSKKEKKDDDKDEEKVAIAHSEPAHSSPVQTKPPEQERIVRDSPNSLTSPSPVEKHGKQHFVPASPVETAKPHVVPIATPSPPPRRVEEQPKPAVSPVVTPVASPATQRGGRDDNAKARTSPESSTSESSGKKKKPHNVKRRTGSARLQEGVLQTKTGPIKEYYNLGQKLGQGQFGTTFQCVEKGTGKEYACKSIAKRKLTTKEDVEDVRREIQIMHHLAGHPNVITIKGAYEDAVGVHVVMELCKGGELFDRIVERGHYSERKAAELSRVIVGVVQSCHSLGVIHRDLKPENFIFVDEKESPIKTIDFGLSVFFKPGDVFHDVVGSPYYVAPEVLNKKYGPEADVWSAGVIIYILLCGVPPFWAEAEEDIFEEVLTGRLDFSEDPWPDISASAKDLLKKMLVRNPKKRMTAPDVLRHPWIQVDGVAPDKPLDSVLRRLNQFSAMNKIKKMALRIIAEKLSVDEIAGLKEMFKMIDTDNSGHITFEELKAGLKAFGANLDDTEMRNLMKAADVDNSGTIDYGEFIAATLHLNKVEREDCLFAAFSYFDKDGSGYITQDELEKACEEFGIEDPRLEEIIQEVDQDNDGRIDYNEFVAMMQDGNFDLGMKGLREPK